MRLRLIVVVVALATVACSNSAKQLASGDPRVCANSDVTGQLFDILKQHVSNPITATDAREFGVDPQSWLDKIRMSVDNVSSTNVDKDNQKIDCNATVHFTATNVAGERTSNVDYRISPDLSSGKIVVSADTSASIIGISGLVAQVAQHDIEKPLKNRADAANARNEAIMAAESARGEAWQREQAERERRDMAKANRPTRVAKHLQPEFPCNQSLNSGEIGCTIVQNYLSGDSPAETDELSPLLSLSTDGKPYAVIQDYQVQPERSNKEVSLTVSCNDKSITLAIHSDRATRVWAITRDRNTCSSIKTKDLRRPLIDGNEVGQ